MELQLDKYGRTDYQPGGISPVEMALSVLDGLDEGAAREALLKLAVEKADAMEDSDLLALDSIGLLWKWVVRSEDKILFDTIGKKLANADTSLVGPSIQYFSQYLSEIGQEKRVVLAPIVVKHVMWLGDKIEALDTKFTWEMPDAHVPCPSEELTKKGKDETAVIDKFQEFLRNGESSMTTEGVKKFKELRDAQNFAAKYLRKGQDHCSFEMEVSVAHGEALLTITKTRDWFLTQQKNLVQYQAELRLLTEKFGDDLGVNSGDTKRTRLSE